MFTITTANLPMTMTSKEMADLTEKRHDNVKRTIETLANQGVISRPHFEDGEKSANGVVEKLYRIGKRDSYVIVAQLSPEFTARLVDRWQQLEDQAKPLHLVPQSLPEALRLAADLAEQKAQAEAALAVAAPKAQALDRIATADGSTCITDAAKVLQARPKDLFQWLQANQWIYRRPGCASWLGYQQRVQQGLLEHKVSTVTRPDGGERVIESVRVTRKGLARLAEAFCKEQLAA